MICKTQNETIDFAEELSSPSQHNAPSPSDANTVNWYSADTVDHMDCTEPTTVRRYENGPLVVDANVVLSNANRRDQAEQTIVQVRWT